MVDMDGPTRRAPGRPKTYNYERQVKGVRISKELNDRLVSVAADYGVSSNVVINRAIEDYLNRLPPIDEVLPVTPKPGVNPSDGKEI